MGVAYGKGAKGKATKLHAEIIRSKGYCEHCGKSAAEAQIQCAHIVSRRYGATRTLLCNAYALCASCHFYFGQWPREFSRYISDTFAGSIYDQLKQYAEAGVKTDYTERATELQRVKKGIESGALTLDEAREAEIAERGLA
jgi:hypothetical protein